MHLGLNVHQPQRDHAVFPARRPGTSDQNEVTARSGAATEHRLTSLVAALIGPFIVLFSIPGLTEFWYTKKGSTEIPDKSQPDPNLIVISGTVTLVLGIIANMLLALRLVETHTRFCIFSGLFILSWFTFINTVALVLFSVKSRTVDDGYVLSTAFSLTAASTALAGLVLVMFFFEGLQTKWYRQGGTGLSGKQRSLTVAFGVFMGTICVGSVMTKFLNSFNSFLDSIYFVIQTITTTGFGDLVPKTMASRIFSIFYDTWGILSFAVVVAFVRSTALEAMQNQYKAREKVILQRIQGQRLERIRTRARTQPEAPRASWLRRFLNRFASYSGPTRARVGAYIGEDQNPEAQRMEMMNPRLLKGNIIADAGGLLHEDDYEETILEMKRERAREHRSELVVSLLIYLSTWVVGAAVFSRLEGWNYFISFYFVFMTFTTIGHGDYAPRTPAGRAFFCAWALVGAGVTTVFFSILADSYSSRFNGLFARNWFKRTLLRFHNNPKARAALEEEERWFGIRPSTNVVDISSRTASTSTSSPAPKPTGEREEDIIESNSSDIEDPTSSQTIRLLELVKQTREHVDDLIHYDSTSSTSEIDREVKQLMDEQKFSIATRLEVMSDERMKRSLYLRRMLAKLVELEKIVKVAVEDYEANRARGEVTEIYIGELGTHVLNSPVRGAPLRTDTNESVK
ncbi:BQ2448_4731 [Microbotryum intermedium]|uniref:BQ2448_4731 protein n=1 Tax=Microbotryum intermedium TaxID=269621 RepID=A0A238FFN0_9BASI|nr:BQ2448_4731 [Microbotryum intermedium]